MNEEQKKQYKERYANAKQHGVKFWPDIIFKDLLISFMLFRGAGAAGDFHRRRPGAQG